jgi:ProP effector
MQSEIFTCLLNRAHSDFPAVFMGRGKPLAIGTDKALFAAWPDMAKKVIRKFPACYCGHPNYLRALAAGGPRYRLDGIEEGEVSVDHQAHAVERLAALEERWKDARTCPDNSAASASSAQPPARKTLRLAAHAPVHRRKLDVPHVGDVKVVTIRRRSQIASGNIFQERNVP